MPRFLSTRGKSVIAIAICARCSMKRAYVDLAPDLNFPGLMVCNRGCRDDKDPYRLPARKTERIDLRRPRPDTDISVPASVALTDGYLPLTDESGNTLLD
jgi:hypothetical protein